MRIRIFGTIPVVLLVLAVAPSMAGSAEPAAAPPTTAPAAPRALAVVPPELQALELKMERLEVTTERYKRTTRFSLEANEEESSSSCRGSKACQPTQPERRKSTHESSFAIEQDGKVNFAARAAELAVVDRKLALKQIAIGSTAYIYLPGTAVPPGRPWVRAKGADAAELLAELSPFHGGLRGEVDAGGRGAYAGLINLLASAVGGVRVVGPATVDGQASTEFTALVVPPDADAGERARTETMQLFITDAGLPLRVVLTSSRASSVISNTTDILAVDVPVTVKPPPARRTISNAQFLTRSRKGGRDSSSSSRSTLG
jgi:hypothetical protein